MDWWRAEFRFAVDTGRELARRACPFSANKRHRTLIENKEAVTKLRRR
jgi:hypothetical protein